MSLILDKPKKLNTPFLVDRPAWIPDDITEDWDTNPYAYQTEEELMPAGGTHNRILENILRLIGHLLEEKELMFLMDVFLLYRDGRGIKRRIAPDLQLMPYRNEAPSAYDLDVEPPPPLIVEVTSPDSHMSDLEEKNTFYLNLGVSTYLVIDAVRPNSSLRDQIELHVWQKKDGQIIKTAPAKDGYLRLPEMGLGIMAKKRELFFKDLETGEVARDAGALAKMLEEERRAKEEERRAKEEERRTRLLVEKENAELRAEIERLRKEKGV